MWKIAQDYTLADDFFMGGFGGSFFNHMWLACACAPYYPDAGSSPAKPTIAVVDPDGVTLTVASNSPASAMDGIPKFVERRQPHARLLRRQHHAASLSAQRQPAGEGREPSLRQSQPITTTLPPQTQLHDRRHDERQGRHLGLVQRRLAVRAGQRQLEACAELPVPSPALQLFCALCARHAGPGPASSRMLASSGVSLPPGDRRGQAAPGLLLQAAGQSQ